MKIHFATGNKNKVKEIRNYFNHGSIEVVSMHDLGFDGDIAETGNTLSTNAAIKANFIHNRFDVNCFADDTGLEIDALNGEPGVYSARYAGDNCSFDDNIQKVLGNMMDQENRAARFTTIIHLILEGLHYEFEGTIKGEILAARSGSKGFGYDPIFKPNGFDKSFAEMSLDQKNKISHRGIAVRKLADFLKSSL